MGTNYARLGGGVILGLIWTRLMLGVLGEAGFGLVMLLGSASGFGMMFQDVLRETMIREVGAAYHSGERSRFLPVFHASFVVSGLILLAAVGVFGTLLAIVPVLEVPPELMAPARWFIVAVTIQTVVHTLTSPVVNMLIVSERFGRHNALLFLARTANLAGALVLLVLSQAGATVGRQIIVYGFVVCALNVLLRTVFAVAMIASTSELRPGVGRATRSEIMSLLGVSAWIVGVGVAMNLHIRLSQVIMNLFFGLVGNTLFGIGVQLTGYVRMLATGMTDGLDAVSTRLSANETSGKLELLIKHATRLHAMIVFPTAWCFGMLLEPIYRVWLGPRFDEVSRPDQLVLISQMLLIGISMRAISDAWIRIFYGAGLLRSYAPLVIAGGLINPLLAVGLVLLLPDRLAPGGPALSFSILFSTIHLIGVPLACRRALNLRLASIYRPLIGPALLSTIVAVPMLPALGAMQRVSPVLALVGGVVYVGLCALLSFVLLLTPLERRRALNLVRARARAGRRG